MAQWITRLPTEHSGFESQYGLVFFFFLWALGMTTKSLDKKCSKVWGDARIELATSCTLSKNHTTRPITLSWSGVSLAILF